jgi:regulatory protein
LKNPSNKTITTFEATRKLEYYCSYQDRCHDEVIQKLRDLKMDALEIDTIVVHLIKHNFLNEERFACSFARGKHRIKFWGKIRIVNELKFRNISKYNIDKALKEISPDEYLENFNAISKNCWDNSLESNMLKKKKKVGDFLLRKGYESNLVYDRLKELEFDLNEFQ